MLVSVDDKGYRFPIRMYIYVTFLSKELNHKVVRNWNRNRRCIIREIKDIIIRGNSLMHQSRATRGCWIIKLSIKCQLLARDGNKFNINQWCVCKIYFAPWNLLFAYPCFFITMDATISGHSQLRMCRTLFSCNPFNLSQQQSTVSVGIVNN